MRHLELSMTCCQPQTFPRNKIGPSIRTKTNEDYGTKEPDLAAQDKHVAHHFHDSGKFSFQQDGNAGNVTYAERGEGLQRNKGHHHGWAKCLAYS